MKVHILNKLNCKNYNKKYIFYYLNDYNKEDEKNVWIVYTMNSNIDNHVRETYYQDIKEILYLKKVNNILHSSIKSMRMKHLCVWHLLEQIENNNNRIQEILEGNAEIVKLLK